MSDKKKIVVALGYFDSVHIGHRKVMEKAKSYAEQKGADFLAFTFGGNLKNALNSDGEKSVYLPFERKRLMKELGADEVYFAPVTSEFLSLEPFQFLDYLNQRYEIIAYSCGKDYRFGKMGAGDVKTLKQYAENKGQSCFVVDTELFLGEKISTTRIKGLLKKGEVDLAGQMLGRSYSVTGVVFHDRKVGKKLGFPTVNIKIDKDKFCILDGVYKGYIILEGKKYLAVINYGARPTFDLSEKLVETHIIDFDGDLYGREITVFFDEFIRSVIKFNDTNELKAQLEIDVKKAKEKSYD